MTSGGLERNDESHPRARHPGRGPGHLVTPAYASYIVTPAYASYFVTPVYTGVQEVSRVAPPSTFPRTGEGDTGVRAIMGAIERIAELMKTMPGPSLAALALPASGAREKTCGPIGPCA